MGFEIEVENELNCQFYGIANSNGTDINCHVQQILQQFGAANSVNIIENGSVTSDDSSTTLDLIVLSGLRRLRRLNIGLNTCLSLRCSVPFLFSLTHLYLCKCSMLAYDFSILLNSLSETLTHLRLEEFSLEESKDKHSSKTMELHRLGRLKVLQLDKTDEEVDSLLPEMLSPTTRLDCIYLSIVSLARVTSPESKLSQHSQMVAAPILTMNGEVFTPMPEDIESLSKYLGAESKSNGHAGKLNRVQAAKDVINSVKERRFKVLLTDINNNGCCSVPPTSSIQRIGSYGNDVEVFHQNVNPDDDHRIAFSTNPDVMLKLRVLP
ncbi:hypothetical protein DdX_13703 [Ditylenchus destructor]|uniref:Uncharacterized protein n=1 Tax=Ditylenchus destructor TaxID=166010 RepID=A0AAD4MUN9_9BILA|nr:hypothetical protein DdX_13703 [Ditylenchus destructor]